MNQPPAMSARQTYHFGAYRVYVAERELFRGSEPVALSPKMFDTLLLLLSRHGHVVDKHELMQSLWPDTFVEEDNLVQQVSRLRKTLGERPEGGPYIETAARRGYRVAAPVEKSWDEEPAGSQPAVAAASGIGKGAGRARVLVRVSLWSLAAVALVVVTIAVAGWLLRGNGRKPGAAPEFVPLTSYPGMEDSPSFSPDGNQVAFAWNGEKEDNWDIYIKLIGTEPPFRLTRNPAPDRWPAWSPDGRRIAFLRGLPEGKLAVVLISPLGGPERILTEVSITPDNEPSSPSWSPDGKWLVTAGLTLISTETGETRNMTSPPTKSSPDFSPAVSPDGRTVAYSRSTSVLEADIYLLDLTEDMMPKGEPRRLTSLKAFSSGPAWASNGQQIVFASGEALLKGGTSLWKVPASGAGEPEQLSYAGKDAYQPAVSRSGNRLAFQRAAWDEDIWRLSLSGPGVASGLPEKLIASTRRDDAPQYSPDGKRIAFESDRSGWQGVWVSNSDGSDPMELFSRMQSNAGSPRWSPDGDRITFGFNAEGNEDVYIIRASGGKPIRLTTDPADDVFSSWSRDGNWVYFASNRTGRWETWKVAATGGEAVRVTRHGGFIACEAPDGKSVYYTKGYSLPEGLWKMPVNGGEESQVLPSVVQIAFSLVKEGIYFIARPGTDGKYSIQFLSFATGKVKTVAPISGSPSEGLSVSPDGRFLLFSQANEVNSDLMLVENFK